MRAVTSERAAHSPFRNIKEREIERALKREALLTAAVRMFNERGFHATSLDDVASSLGITKPVIYHYLGSKDQVLFECVRIGLEQLQTAVADSRKAYGSGLDRLKTFLRRYAQVNMEDFGRCVIRTGEEMLSSESRVQFRALKRDIDNAMRRMIEEAVTDGSAQVEDVRLTAFTLAGALNWPARWYREDGAQSAEEIAHKMVDALCQGLVPRASDPKAGE
jgi:AcrR family transcriptional regulator